MWCALGGGEPDAGQQCTQCDKRSPTCDPNSTQSIVLLISSEQIHCKEMPRAPNAESETVARVHWVAASQTPASNAHNATSAPDVLILSDACQ